MAMESLGGRILQEISAAFTIAMFIGKQRVFSVVVPLRTVYVKVVLVPEVN
jgi:hypothetical protein